ncbi:predicted protein [Thalassiosira pseudonana CCMP1335]|uniref:Uncharacterized protein n=1 Tax=Thalassiosira pseudonana TaxID=35128 RepID=B8BVX5_THAPS|nr:predicted protein [Thalassiosira pseudonana CCMP1335]EED95015.1 predicted protein [Thalassiosira pseudonana CCMP1335]
MTSESEAPSKPATPPPTPSQPSTSSKFQPQWQLPQGIDALTMRCIENHIEALVLKSLLGATIGATTGFLLFRSGRGANAMAGMMFGVGCAVGSFVERGILGEPGRVDPAVPRFNLDFMKDIGK